MPYPTPIFTISGATDTIEESIKRKVYGLVGASATIISRIFHNGNRTTVMGMLCVITPEDWHNTHPYQNRFLQAIYADGRMDGSTLLVDGEPVGLSTNGESVIINSKSEISYRTVGDNLVTYSLINDIPLSEYYDKTLSMTFSRIYTRKIDNEKVTSMIRILMGQLGIPQQNYELTSSTIRCGCPRIISRFFRILVYTKSTGEEDQIRCINDLDIPPTIR